VKWSKYRSRTRMRTKKGERRWRRPASERRVGWVEIRMGGEER